MLKKTSLIIIFLIILSSLSFSKEITLKNAIYYLKTKSNYYKLQKITNQQNKITDYNHYHTSALSGSLSYQPNINNNPNQTSSISGSLSYNFDNQFNISYSDAYSGFTNSKQSSISISKQLRDFIFSKSSYNKWQFNQSITTRSIDQKTSYNQAVNSLVSSYIAILKAKSNLKFQEETLKEEKLNLKFMKLKLNSTSTKLSYLQAKLNYEVSENQTKIQRQQFVILVKNLCQTLNIEYSSNLTLRPIDGLQISKKDFQNIGKISLEKLKLAKESGQETLKYDKVWNNGWPNLSVSVNYTPPINAESSPKDAWSVSLTSDFTFKKNFVIKQQELTLKQNVINRKQQLISIEKSKAETIQNYKNMLFQLNISKQKLSVSQKQFKINKLKYYAGEISYEKYQQAIESKEKSQISYLNNQYSLYELQYKLKYPVK